MYAQLLRLTSAGKLRNDVSKMLTKFLKSCLARQRGASGATPPAGSEYFDPFRIPQPDSAANYDREHRTRELSASNLEQTRPVLKTAALVRYMALCAQMISHREGTFKTILDVGLGVNSHLSTVKYDHNGLRCLEATHISELNSGIKPA
jgi:hypothetical protein